MTNHCSFCRGSGSWTDQRGFRFKCPECAYPEDRRRPGSVRLAPRIEAVLRIYEGRSWWLEEEQ